MKTPHRLFYAVRWLSTGLTALLLAPPALQAAGAPFLLQLPENATSKQIDFVLNSERAHRKLYPQDTIVIELPPHLSLTAPLVLGAGDSGRRDAPLVLRGAVGSGSTITGAVTMNSEGNLDLTSEPLSRMSSAVRSRVRRVRFSEDLSAKTRPAFVPNGSFTHGPIGRLIIFEAEHRLQPAHWPATGYATSPTLVSGPGDSLRFLAPDPIPGLDREADLWASGYWGWSWWYEMRKVTSASGGVIAMANPEAPVRPGARYRLVNLAAGLLREGLYYRDAADGCVYFIPAAINRAEQLSVAVATTLLKVDAASHIEVEGIAFEMSLGAAVLIDHSDNIRLHDCYVGHTGSHGVVMRGTNDVLENCVVDDVGETAVSISGGDRMALTSSNDAVRHTLISHFGRVTPTYRPGLNIDGVGVTVEGCEISGSPHAGIIFTGNDHRIRGNILHDLATDSGDSGAIYSGRNWTAQGTAITQNYIYDVVNLVDSSSVVGLYLDDQLSGTVAEANVFSHVDVPVLIGGGRNNLVRDNLAVAAKGAAIAIDARGLGWQADMAKPDGMLAKGLQAVPYKGPAWTRHYPWIANTLEDRPGAPVDNEIADNLSDGDPVVAFDRPETASYTKSSANGAVAKAPSFAFPQSLNGLPDGARARPQLEKTRDVIAATLQAMQTLPFRYKVVYDGP